MSYRAQVPDTATLILNGGSDKPLMVTNVGSNTVYVSENGSVTAGTDQLLDIGGSLVVNPKSQLWAVSPQGFTSSLAVTTNVGQRFAYAAAASRPISSTLLTKSYGPTGAGGTAIRDSIIFDNSLASQFSSVQIVLSRNDTRLVLPVANTYIVTYTDYVAPINNYNATTTYPVIQNGQQQQVMITNALFYQTTPQPIWSVTFPTRGYGGSYSIRPLTDTLSTGLTVQIVGQSESVTEPKIWVNPYALESTSNGYWLQTGNFYSRLDNSSYSGSGGTTPNYYDFLLPPTNGQSQLSVEYTFGGGGGPIATWQLYSYVGYSVSTVETFGKVATSNILSTATLPGTYNFTTSFNFIPKNPTYLRFGLTAYSSMSSCQITIGGEKT